MRVIIGGGTGFIGQALTSALKRRGDEVLLLSRTAAPGRLTWDEVRTDGLPSCDAVINLAGANVMAKRWNHRYRNEIFSSRIDTTQQLASAIRQSPSPPSVFVSASAISYYASGGPHDEAGPAGTDFLSLVAQSWEGASILPPDCPTRRVNLRIGIVLGKQGGALKRLLPVFRMGLGGPVGSGKQPFCWIHIEDLVSLFMFALDHPIQGPLNGVAPNPVSMSTFARALGKALRKPAWLPTPSWALKLLLGDRARVLLSGPHVIPKRAPDAGFCFTYPELPAALSHLTTDDRSPPQKMPK